MSDEKTVREGIKTLESSIIMAAASRQAYKDAVEATVAKIKSIPEAETLETTFEFPQLRWGSKQRATTDGILDSLNRALAQFPHDYTPAYLAEINTTAEAKRSALDTASQSTVDAWNEALELLGEAFAAYTYYRKDLSAKATAGQELGRTVIEAKTSPLIRGAQVYVATSRRQTTGWVVGGRGNTIHVQPTRWEWSAHTPVDGWPSSGGLSETYLFDPPEKMTFQLSNLTTLTVLVPPGRLAAKQEFAEGKWTVAAKITLDQARAKYKVRQDWVDKGGEDLERRNVTIQRILKEMNAIPFRNGIKVDSWMKAAESLLDEDTWKELAIEQYLKDAKLVRLTEAELEILGEKPTTMARQLHDVWTAEWRNYWNPPKEEAVSSETSQ